MTKLWSKCGKAIKPRKKIVKLNEETTVPVVRNTGGWSHIAVTLLWAQLFTKETKRDSKNINVNKPLVLEPETQRFTTVSTVQTGLINFETNKKFFESNMCLVGTGIAHIRPDAEFWTLVSKVGKYSQTLTIRGNNRLRCVISHRYDLIVHNTQRITLRWSQEAAPQTPLWCKRKGSDQSKLCWEPRKCIGEKHEEPITALTALLSVQYNHQPAIEKILKKQE